jgi:hypothetical protein
MKRHPTHFPAQTLFSSLLSSRLSVSSQPFPSSLPVTAFALVPENGLLYGELRRAVVKRCKNHTPFMASDQKREVSDNSEQNRCSLLLEYVRRTV